MESNILNKYLKEDEEIIWKCKPNKKAFTHNLLSNYKKKPYVWIIPQIIFIFMGFYSGVFTSGKVGIILIYLMFMLLFSIPIWATLAQLIKNYNRQKNVEYVFTNYNIIINYENSVTKIKYKDITDVSVEEEKHSQKYGVESIVITKLDYANFVLHDLENAQSVSIRIKDLVYKSKNNMM